VYGAWHLGEGDNLPQKVLNFWPFVAVVFAACVILLGLVLGKERIRILGEPFNRLLGS
jgi:hypothetical protein